MGVDYSIVYLCLFDSIKTREKKGTKMEDYQFFLLGFGITILFCSAVVKIISREKKKKKKKK